MNPEPRTINPQLLAGVAVSDLSPAQRMAIVLLHGGGARSAAELMGPCFPGSPRLAKVMEKVVYPLKNRGLIVHTDRGWALREEMVVKLYPAPVLSPSGQRVLVMDPPGSDLGEVLTGGDAAAQSCPVRDGTRPVRDGTGVFAQDSADLSRPGQDGAHRSVPIFGTDKKNFNPIIIDPIVPDRLRIEVKEELRKIQFRRPAVVPPYIEEKLKLPKLQRLAAELRGEVPQGKATAARFWYLLSRAPDAAVSLLGQAAADGDYPHKFLTTLVQNYFVAHPELLSKPLFRGPAVPAGQSLQGGQSLPSV